MTPLRELTAPDTYERVVIQCRPIPFPICFYLPEEVRETMPLSKVKAIEGQFILRFYSVPNPGDTVAWKGHKWKVERIAHRCQVKGSPKPDRLPVIHTEYLGLDDE